MFSINNYYKLLLGYSFFILLYIILNKFISLMSFSGIAINILSLTILFFAILYKKIEFIFIFFIFNILLGPFMIVNFSQIGLDTFGRLDYFIANILMLYFIGKRNRHVNLVIIINLALFVSIIVNYDSSLDYMSRYYSYISNISMGYLFYYFWTHRQMFQKQYIFQILFALLFVHLLLSLIQFFYPFYLRQNSVEAGLQIFGYSINRPLGFFGASFVYGLSTCFLVVFYYYYKEKINFYQKYTLILLLAISMLSTRSIILGLLLYVVYFAYVRLSKGKRIFFLVFSFSLVVAFILQYYQLFFLNQSNSTKLLLWYLTMKDYLFNSSVIQVLFGHGIESASLIANSLPDFASNLLFEAGYDNRVDAAESEGFPIHNIYLQMLYENGLILFCIISFFIIKLLDSIVKYKLTGLEPLLFFLILTNYLLHNGAFSFMLFFIIFALLDKTKNREVITK